MKKTALYVSIVAAVALFISVAFAESFYTLTVKKTSTLTGAVTMGSTLSVTGISTFTGAYIPKVVSITDGAATDSTKTISSTDYGKIYTSSTTADSMTVILPTPSSSTVGASFRLTNLVDKILCVWVTSQGSNANAIIADGVLTSDAVSFATSSHKIGGQMQVIGISATKWLITNVSVGCTMTVDAAD